MQRKRDYLKQNTSVLLRREYFLEMIINVDKRDFLNISNDDEKTAKVPKCQEDNHEKAQVIATEGCTENNFGSENQY